jgi:hypothetical protein
VIAAICQNFDINPNQSCLLLARIPRGWQRFAADLGDVEVTMPQFDPELIQLMRSVLEDAMTRVPVEITGITTKAYLAEGILKAAAQGHTSYNELLAAATDQIQVIVSMLT